MNIISFSLKNILTRWWRTLSIGFFIFLSTIMMLFFYSFVDAVKEKINNVMIHGITGHIQIRSDRSFEDDMVEIYHKNWSSITPIDSIIATKIKNIFNESFNFLKFYSMVRHIVYLNNDKNKKSQQSLLIGIELAFYDYKKSFHLIKGKYLNKESYNEILITKEQAKELNLDIGDEVLIKTKDKMGLSVEKKFIIAGIGEFFLLSFFSYKTCYIDIRSLQNLINLDNDEISDLIIHIPEKSRLKKTIDQIKKAFDQYHIDFELTSEEKIKSNDIKIKNFDFDEFDKTSKKVKISSFLEMGKMFKSINQIIFIIINILFVLFLIIISLLISNMVILMIIERFYEIGTLRAIGFSRFYIVLLFISEIVIITLFFTFIGLISGSLLIFFINYKEISSTIPFFQFFLSGKLYLLLKPEYFIIILSAMNVFSLLSSFFPVYKACSIKPIEFLRDK